MTRLGAVSRRELIRRLRKLGWAGPSRGGKHDFMTMPGRRPLRIPNEHGADIGRDLLRRILAQADVSHDEWTTTRSARSDE